jgi:hypothetical protein
VRRLNAEELRVLRPEAATYIGSFSKMRVGGSLGVSGLRLRASYPFGQLLVTQDKVVLSLALGLSRLARPWLLDRADVIFESWGRTVWLTDDQGSCWRFWSPNGAELVAQLESLGYRRRASGS